MEHQKTIVEQVLSIASSYRREILLGMALAMVALGSVGGYFWYKDRIARTAHKAYTQACVLRDARILKGEERAGAFETAFTDETEKWEATAHAFAEVYKLYPHVGIGIMAGAAQVQSLVRLGKFEQARTLMATVVPRITSPQLRALFNVTYAQLLLDSDQDADVQRGVGLLAQSATTKDNPLQDTALYYLGLYYWHKNDFSNARNYWNQLVLQYQADAQHSSPWVALAQENLALLGDEATTSAS